jgi:hypothetical protein
VVVIVGAVGAAFAFTKTGKTLASLPAKFTAAQFERTLLAQDSTGTTTRETESLEISLGSDGTITESQIAVADTANKEQQLTMTETLNTAGSKPITIESIHDICFAQNCYVSGNFIGFPVTGTTNAHWLAVTVPKLHSIANPLAVIGHVFRGTVHETRLPQPSPSGGAAAYVASGTFTFEQAITALAKSLPNSVTKLASNSKTASVLSGMTMSFRKAIVVVNSDGALVRFDTPLTMNVTAAAASALGENSGPISYSGNLLVSRSNAASLHLVKPLASTVTTPAAVKAAVAAAS